MFSYLSPEQRVRPNHPLRAIRTMTDHVLRELSPRFRRMYSDIGRPSIPPEQLLSALLLQALYTVRSERLLMEEIDYSILFRWFIGLSLDEPIWSPTTFSKNRDRLLTATSRVPSSTPYCARRGTPRCCRTSTSPSMGPCSRRGRD
jgi:transposase